MNTPKQPEPESTAEGSDAGAAGEAAPRFDDLPLSAEARAGVAALGYEVATPVQAAVYRIATAGSDLMVQSKTGTGKTTAFGLPVVERVTAGGAEGPQAIMLCPTRELAGQVSQEVSALGGPKQLSVTPIYGGAAIGPQLKQLEAGTDIVVGTPGRVLDHIRRGTLKLDACGIAVLDEADEMLSMGFWDEVTAILDQLPKARQTLLFSATLPDEIRKTALTYMSEPEMIDISQDELTVEGITNYYYESDERIPKPRNMLYVLEVEQPESAIIFCNTRDDVNIVAAFLRRQGLHAMALSGELAQKDRERVMARMKRGDLKYLVATDIAARGIDISDLSHVFLYSLPNFTEVYLHRVGRTGRAGKKGFAVSLVGGRDEVTFTELERKYGVEFEKKELPEADEIQRMQAERIAGELLEKARDTEITSFLRLAEHLKETKSGREVVGFLLKFYFAALEEERMEGLPKSKPSARDQEWARDDRDRDRGRDRDRDRGRRGRDRDEGRGRRRGRDEDYPHRDRDEERPRRDRDEERPRRGRDEERPHRDRGEERPHRDRDEERPRRPRREAPAEAAASAPVEAGPVFKDRVFVNRGSADGYDVDAVRAMIAELAADHAEAVGGVQLRRTHAFVQLSPEAAEQVLKAVEGGLQRDDRPVAIERARSRR